MPLGFKKNLKITPTKIGVARRQELLDGIADHGTYLPKGVMEEDLDTGFIDFVTNDLSITIDGQKVPVIFLTIQRWTEFSKTWQFSDKHKNIKIPFITIVRHPDIQVGTNQAGLWNIPGRRTYTYYKVPTWDGNRKGIDLYKIPQPTSVDITYEVKLFCNKMKDLNVLNQLIHQEFNARQRYIFIKGHPMPVMLENVGDESNVDDFENRRFYVQQFEMLLAGYILDESKFEVVPTINRVLVVSELEQDTIKPKFKVIVNKQNNLVTYSVVFQSRSEPHFSFTAEFDIKLTQLINIENISNILIKVDGVQVLNGITLTTPIIIQANQSIYIEVVKDFYSTGKFQLLGNLI